MARINTNISAIRAMTRLQKNTEDLSLHLNRLSTGLRINNGKDDPAGLIASENLRAEMASTRQAIDNSTRAGSVIATAEGALSEVSALLLDIKGLLNASANEGALAPEEIKANQLQIDSAVQSVNRIANSTSFEGNKLLNGSMDFTTTGVANTVKDLRMQEVRFGTATTMTVRVEVSTAATRASLLRATSGVGVTAVTLEVAGNKGVEVFTFQGSAKTSAILFAVNQAKDVTGVSARLSGAGQGIYFESMTYGAKSFVSVKAISGTFALAGGVNRAEGTDATVLVNGVKAVAEGLDIQINGPSLFFEASLDSTLNTVGGNTTFTVTGGGAQFQLGPNVNAQQMAIVGIQSVAAHMLGSTDYGYLRDITTGGSKSVLAGKYQEAENIVTAAVEQVAKLRGRMGAFRKNTLETNINSLSVALENVTASESAIRDADFAEETAAMTRAQILVQAGTSVLAIANAAPQNVLALLG